MTDEEKAAWSKAEAVAADCVIRFRSLVEQNDGVLRAIIRDALFLASDKATAMERERCAKERA